MKRFPFKYMNQRRKKCAIWAWKLFFLLKIFNKVRKMRKGPITIL